MGGSATQTQGEPPTGYWLAQPFVSPLLHSLCVPVSFWLCLAVSSSVHVSDCASVQARFACEESGAVVAVVMGTDGGKECLEVRTLYRSAFLAFCLSVHVCVSVCVRLRNCLSNCVSQVTDEEKAAADQLKKERQREAAKDKLRAMKEKVRRALYLCLRGFHLLSAFVCLPVFFGSLCPPFLPCPPPSCVRIALTVHMCLCHSAPRSETHRESGEGG